MNQAQRKQRYRKRPGAAGFTLSEAVVSIVILRVMAALGIFIMVLSTTQQVGS